MITFPFLLSSWTHFFNYVHIFVRGNTSCAIVSKRLQWNMKTQISLQHYQISLTCIINTSFFRFMSSPIGSSLIFIVLFCSFELLSNTFKLRRKYMLRYHMLSIINIQRHARHKSYTTTGQRVFLGVSNGPNRWNRKGTYIATTLWNNIRSVHSPPTSINML